MKNLVVCAVFATLFAWVASADANHYLYWGVNVGDNSQYAFNYATISAKASSSESDAWSTLSLYMSSDSSSSFTKLYANSDTSSTGTSAGGIFAGVDGYVLTGSQFLVELWTTTGDSATPTRRVAWQSVGYDTVKGSIFDGLSNNGSSAYTFTQFVPEPTSGLLLLLGCAALALRRKQNVA